MHEDMAEVVRPDESTLYFLSFAIVPQPASAVGFGAMWSRALYSSQVRGRLQPFTIEGYSGDPTAPLGCGFGHPLPRVFGNKAAMYSITNYLSIISLSV
jgi:hypothetical protein